MTPLGRPVVPLEKGSAASVSSGGFSGEGSGAVTGRSSSENSLAPAAAWRVVYTRARPGSPPRFKSAISAPSVTRTLAPEFSS